MSNFAPQFDIILIDSFNGLDGRGSGRMAGIPRQVVNENFDFRKETQSLIGKSRFIFFPILLDDETRLAIAYLVGIKDSQSRAGFYGAVLFDVWGRQKYSEQIRELIKKVENYQDEKQRLSQHGRFSVARVARLKSHYNVILCTNDEEQLHHYNFKDQAGRFNFQIPMDIISNHIVAYSHLLPKVQLTIGFDENPNCSIVSNEYIRAVRGHAAAASRQIEATVQSDLLQLQGTVKELESQIARLVVDLESLKRTGAKTSDIGITKARVAGLTDRIEEVPRQNFNNLQPVSQLFGKWEFKDIMNLPNFAIIGGLIVCAILFIIVVAIAVSIIGPTST